jgi:hypothetical protein
VTEGRVPDIGDSGRFPALNVEEYERSNGHAASAHDGGESHPHSPSPPAHFELSPPRSAEPEAPPAPRHVASDPVDAFEARPVYEPAPAPAPAYEPRPAYEAPSAPSAPAAAPPAAPSAAPPGTEHPSGGN